MRSGLFLAVCVGASLLLMGRQDGLAQKAIILTPGPLTSLIQASDGNLYGVYPGQANLSSPNSQCVKGLNDACGGIYVVRKDGSVSEMHQLQVGGSQAPEGNLPVSLVEGPDGFLYGTTVYGGTGGPSGCDGVGCGVFFRIGLDGAVGPNTSFTVLHSFSYAEDARGGSIILGSDGNFYGVGNQNDFGPRTIYKITPLGAVTVLYDFSYSATPPNPYANGAFPSGVVEGTDGNLYGTTLASSDSGYAGTVFQMTPGGTLKTIAGLPGDGTLGVNPGALVEGPDGALYGATRGASYNSLANPLATVFRVTTDGKFTTLHTFSTVADGIYPISSPLIVAADGNIYGTTQDGGDPSHCAYYDGCGVMFGITPAGAFTPLVTFAGGAKGAFPNTLIADAGGNITGTTGSDGTAGSADTLFTSPPLSLIAGQAPINVAFYDPATGKQVNQANPGAPVLVKWNVLNAFSKTMRQCAAFRQDIKDQVWTGIQAGTAGQAGFGGQATIKAPLESGNYAYSLTCGGVESGNGTLQVGSNLLIDTLFLPDAVVSVKYSTVLVAQGGIAPYTWSVLGGGLPKGLTLDPSTGAIFGTPLQYDTYTLSFVVQDSSTVPLTGQTTLTMKITSGLIPFQATPNAVVGTSYSQLISATGGLPPYVYKFVSGQLPPGLAFNASAGLVSGTPTKTGTFTFSVSVTDSEALSAMATQTYVINTAVQPLTITTSIDLPAAVVNTPYTQIFSATGGTPPYTWTVVAGSTLPSGLTLSSTGVLSGKCLQYGRGYFEIQVTDSETPPVTVSKPADTNITSGLTIAPFSLPNGAVGVAFDGPLPVATGGIPPYTWRAGATPVGYGFDQLNIINATGEIFGTPPVATTFKVNLYLEDSEGSPASTSYSFFWTIDPPPLPTTTTLQSSNASAGTGMPVTFTATVVKSGGGPASGVVTFLSGGTILGNASLDTNGNAALTTSFSTAGQYSVTANYSGAAGLTQSVSAALTETVITPAVTATVNPVTLTLQAGSSGTIALIVTPVGGYTGTVTFSCGTLPAHVSCTFAPPTLTIAAGGAAVTDTLTINTGSAASAANRVPLISGDSGGGMTMALGLWLPGPLLLFGTWSRRRRALRLRNALAVVALGLAGLALLNGCGSASNKAAPGTSTVTISITAGAAVQTVNATVVVQ